MAIEYKITYQCRLCDEIFSIGYTRDREIAVEEIAKVASGISGRAHLYQTHHCDGIDGFYIGLADFIGIKGVKE